MKDLFNTIILWSPVIMYAVIMTGIAIIGALVILEKLL